MSRPAPPILALGAAVLGLLWGGCGGGVEPVRVQDGVVDVTLVDFRVRPQIVHSSAQPLTFRVRNRGRLPHAFRVRGIGGTRMKISTILPGRESSRVGIRLPRGDWRLFCPLANHEELGMYGVLVIR